jgi:hypothetical protein
LAWQVFICVWQLVQLACPDGATSTPHVVPPPDEPVVVVPVLVVVPVDDAPPAPLEVVPLEGEPQGFVTGTQPLAGMPSTVGNGVHA